MQQCALKVWSYQSTYAMHMIFPQFFCPCGHLRDHPPTLDGLFTDHLPTSYIIILQKDTLYLVMRCTRWRQGANHCALLCVSLLVRVLIYVRTFLMTIIFLKVGIVWTRQLIISFIIMDLISTFSLQAF